MEFLVLGPLQVHDDDGRPVALGSGRQTRLLATLLLSAGEVVSRDRLIDALWGERPPPTAAKAVQVQVHALRKLLGQERIGTVEPGYRLRIEPGELDLERFERLVARGRGELAAGDGEAAATLREALALWRGPALMDVAYEPFAQAEIARLEELRLVALEERIEADLALARHEDLVPELESLVSLHPSRERLHGQLMVALYRSGRQRDALAVFRRARRALRDELGLEPGPELQKLQQAILRQDAVLRVEPPELRRRRHLPAATTTLVGRHRELDELGSLLRTGARLVTLTGPGGSGKTRLALQTAHELADAFVDGVYFVDLAPLREPAIVPSAIAHALGVEERSDEPVAETLRTYLRPRRLLLLLDNFEVVEGAAPQLSELLQAAPELALLVTSRTPLRLSAEHERRVFPLPLADAVRLFAARARAVAPGFRRPSEEAAEVAEICRCLDRLPLAIELAAARTREYSPAELLELLSSPLALASGGALDLPERQRTLRATVDWSYELLTAHERGLFARLAVFAGGCSVAAVETVCAAGRGSLASLVAKSLLYERLGGDGEVRFAMLETVREYALERLQESGDEEIVRRRHAEHYAALAEAAEAELTAPGQEHRLELLEEEHDNLRAALTWSRGTGAIELELRLVSALAPFWGVRAHLREGRSRIEAALSHGKSGPVALRAKALAGATSLAMRLGDYEQMKALGEEHLALSRSLGDQRGIAVALDRLATAASFDDDVARATSLYQQSVAIHRELGDQRGLAASLTNLGCLALIEGEYERATALSEEALALYEQVGRRDGMLQPISNLGFAALLQDRHREALALFRQGIRLAHELKFTEGLIYCLEGLAAVLAAAGDAEQAPTLLGAAHAAAEQTGVSLEPFEREIHERTVEAVRNALGEEAFAAMWAAGRQLTTDEATAQALAFSEAPTRPVR